jgi:glycosyltransferase involved in cell wall biosynthesis
MVIRVIGEKSILGVGVHYMEFCAALRRLHGVSAHLVEVNRNAPTEVEQAVSNSGDSDINIHFFAKPIQGLRGVHILWFVFESTRIQPRVVAGLHHWYNLIWTPSDWGRRILIDAGLDPARVDVVPEGVNPRRYHPFLRSGRPDDGVHRFLMLGKFEERKSYRESLQAFADAFRNQSDVELLIKADYFLDHDRKRETLSGLVEAHGLTNVRLLWGAWPHEALLTLYSRADTFVFPSKAEGWGLPLIEAAACGLPLVTTYHSGQTEYLQDIMDSVVQVPFRMTDIDDPEYMRFWGGGEQDHGQWAQPDAEGLRDALVESRARHQDLSLRACANSQRIRTHFSWDASVNRSLDILARRRLLSLSAALPPLAEATVRSATPP